MSILRVTTVQTQLHWEDVEANLQMFSQKLAPLKGQTDLVVLPESFSTGFSMRPDVIAEQMNGQSMLWMKKQAAQLGVPVCGSLFLAEDGQFFNRFIFMRPDGTYQQYDKRHLFSMGKEDQHFTAGTKNTIIEYNGWKILPQICYDLRFPVWSRNTTNYDLAIYVANWPEKRNYAWKSLLQARAIENQSYVIGVNRVGADGLGTTHSGDTMVFDPYGEAPLYHLSHSEAEATHQLDQSKIEKIRQKLPFLIDRDSFEIKFG